MADIAPIANNEAGSSVRAKLNAAIAALNARPENNLTATVAPTVNDDSAAGYAPNSVWFDTVASEMYRCLDATVGAATWITTSLTLDELGTAALSDAGDFAAEAPNDGLPYLRQSLSWVRGLARAGDSVLNISETRQTVTDGTIDADLGGIVDMTLSADATLAISNLSDGQWLTVHITGGDTWSMDWATNHTIAWHGAGVPVLGAVHTVLFEQAGATLYGYDGGEVV